MTNPKLKNLNLTLRDYSLKNRLINFYAREQGMSDKQYKEFLTQSINIFTSNFASNSVLAESIEKAVTNFINKSNKISLSVKPQKSLSVNDILPDITTANTDAVIKKLNLRLSN